MESTPCWIATDSSADHAEPQARAVPPPTLDRTAPPHRRHSDPHIRCHRSVQQSYLSLANIPQADAIDRRWAVIRCADMGTDAWRNWNAYNEQLPEIENLDEELYSDRHFVGGPSAHGPYSLATIIGHDRLDTMPTVRPAVRMHVGVHANLIPDIVIDGKLVPADSDAYHGGNASDEIAALSSLALGVRLRVAGTSQLSGRHEGGQEHPPIYLQVVPLANPGRPGRERIPAALNRSAHLDRLSRLDSFPDLNEEAQVELVRAARAYATGLWWSNEDPNHAWLQMVTAVEIAANHRQRTKASPEALVEDLWPELWAALQPAEDAVRTEVMRLVAPLVRATRKFVDFLVECAPEPLELRPPFAGLDWVDMAHHAKLIYRHRSTALHGGKPFPLPMLVEPRTEENGAIQEVPWGLNAGGPGGIWDAKETPMLLSTFEYIARGALLTWWNELYGGEIGS